jgi:hypothetical protein
MPNSDFYSYSYQWDEMDGYDCMTGAFKISGPNGFVVYVDQRDYGQKPCDYEDQASKVKAEAATKLITDTLNGLLGPNELSTGRLPDRGATSLSVPPPLHNMPKTPEFDEAREALLALAAMPPEGSMVDGIRLLASRANPHAREQALDEAARTVQLELRKFWPHGKNAAAAILALKRTHATGERSDA